MIKMTSRERILQAAIPVFARKGRHGAHMEEIAKLAHINKAMIYYIFHNKDDLYFEVLKKVLGETSDTISRITDNDLKSGKGYEEVLSNLITAMISFLTENSYYTKIFIDSISSSSDEVTAVHRYYKENLKNSDPTITLKEFIATEIELKHMRHVDPDQLIISIIGMTLIFFLSDSLKTSLNIEISDERAFIEERRKSIIDLVLSGLRPDTQQIKAVKTAKKRGSR